MNKEIIKRVKKRNEVINYLQDKNNVQFSEEQYKILLSEKNTLVVDAVPGSGKTFTLINKAIIEALLKPTNKVLIISHTNAVVNEMRYKINNSKINPTYLRNIQVSTIDSLLKRRILDRFGYKLDLDTLEGNSSWLEDIDLTQEEQKLRSKIIKYYEEGDYLSYMKARDVYMDKEVITKTYPISNIEVLSNRLLKEISTTITEEDVQQRTRARALELDFDWILVDEYQDLTVESIEALSIIQSLNSSCNILFFGDINQSIFRFSDPRLKELESSTVENLEDWEELKEKYSKYTAKEDIKNIFPEVGQLSIINNRRNASSIVEHVNSFSTEHVNIANRQIKGEANIYWVEDKGYKDKIKLKDGSCLLFRRNTELVDEFVRLSLQGIEVESQYIDNLKLSPTFKYIQAIIDQYSNLIFEEDKQTETYFKLFLYKEDNKYSKRDFLQNLENYKTSIRIEPLNFRDFDNQDIKNSIVSINKSLKDKSFKGVKKGLDRFFKERLNINLSPTQLKAYTGIIFIELINITPRNTKITLHTIHTSKGLEFDHVVVMPFKKPPNVKTIDPLEETNLLYVAVSRARNELDLIINRENFVYNKYNSGKFNRNKQ